LESKAKAKKDKYQQAKIGAKCVDAKTMNQLSSGKAAQDERK
jgi:hypothetical protein